MELDGKVHVLEAIDSFSWETDTLTFTLVTLFWTVSHVLLTPESPGGENHIRLVNYFWTPEWIHIEVRPRLCISVQPSMESNKMVWALSPASHSSLRVLLWMYARALLYSLLISITGARNWVPYIPYFLVHGRRFVNVSVCFFIF